MGRPDRAFRRSRTSSRSNLLARLERGGPLFQGVVGYEDTVMPQIVNALLSRHNFILLGLRGQAKSRILRALTTLLDDAIPIVAGSEVNDNPFAPISKYARNLLDEARRRHADRLARARQRYVEKLATPDVTVADIIGDVDPIKAARGGHVLSDELTMHYGMLPRANRGIFALNELPDLAGKVQVGLFNIMQEGDVQIKGYPVRLPLDVLLCFTANPEDYTARGKIITPLKDRIGSEIMTHYPGDRRARDGRSRSRKRGPSAAAGRCASPTSSPRWSSASRSRRATTSGSTSDRASPSACRSRVLENVVSNAERRAIADGRGGDRSAHRRHLRCAARHHRQDRARTRASSLADTTSRAS